MPMSNLQDAFLHELKDVYSAEKQLAQALPRMAKAAGDEQLAALFNEHLEQTKGQIERIEQVFKALDKSARATRCEAMAGIVEEGKSTMEEEAEPPVKDAMLIGAAQKAEHYEIATYGTLCTWAKQLKLEKPLELLKQTLAEEKETDQKLTRLAERRKNPEAAKAS